MLVVGSTIGVAAGLDAGKFAESLLFQLDSRDPFLEMNLAAFQEYSNGHRTHSALDGQTPIELAKSRCADLESYR
jgi:hypothetical protein